MEYIDLTQPLRDGSSVFPGDPEIEISPHATFSREGYRVTRLSFGSHSGTHIDAPSHFFPSGRTVDEYPIETFAFETVVVDVTGCDPRESIDRTGLSDISGVDLVVFATGWDRYYDSPEYDDHPVIGPDLAQWLADAGYHVGIDAPSVDPSPAAGQLSTDADSLEYPAHKALLGADRVIVENLAQLQRVPTRFTLLAFPLSIPGVEAAPIRAVAAVE